MRNRGRDSKRNGNNYRDHYGIATFLKHNVIVAVLTANDNYGIATCSMKHN